MHTGNAHEGGRELTEVDAGVVGGAVALVAGATHLGLNANTNVAAILTFTGAIFVALLTAYWTQRRQSQQLAADQQRLQLQLEHERERLDLLDLRAVLEEALAASDEVFTALRLVWHAKVLASEARLAIGPFSGFISAWANTIRS